MDIFGGLSETTTSHKAETTGGVWLPNISANFQLQLTHQLTTLQMCEFAHFSLLNCPAHALAIEATATKGWAFGQNSHCAPSPTPDSVRFHHSF